MRAIWQTTTAAALLLLAACGSGPETAAPPAAEAPASTAWTLAAADSRISFASVKAGTVGEGHRFGQMSGQVGPDGAFSLTIPLDSVETKIDIRNERLRTMLFETAQFPSATFTGAIDLAQFNVLKPGQRLETTLAGTLDLHGVQAPVEVPVLVTRVGPDRVAVDTVEPVLIEASVFKLDGGLEQLRAIAKLPAISPVVPVHADLIFTR